MPEFRYSARDKHGERVEGTRDASSAAELSEQLQQESFIPLDITSVQTKATSSIFKINIKTIELPKIFQSRVSQKELQMFCRQMYSLLKAGIPIVSAVTRLQETTQNSTLQQALEKVLQILNQGQSLSAGLKESPHVFNEFFINLVKVGETSGELDTVFMHLADYIELEVDTEKKIKTAFRYPKMVGVALFVALLVINTFVVPSFSDLFKSFKGTLPLPTRILMGMSEFILGYWYIVLGVGALCIMTFSYVIKTPRGKIKWAEFKLKIPIMGWIVHRITLARFAKLFAMVLRAGLTAVDGINLVGASTNDAYFADRIKLTSDLIVRGSSISSAIEQTHLFPPLMIQMIALGEESGNIDNLLDEVAEFYQRELVYDLAHLSEMIEPILLLVVGVMVLLLALGVFLPMWDLSSQME